MRFILALLFLAGFAAAGEPLFAGKLTDLVLTDTTHDPAWKPRAGLVIDNVDDLSGLSLHDRMAAETIAAQIKSIGARACGEYFYNVDGQVLKFITLRVFVFADVEKANAFYKLKYTSEAGAKFYDKVDAPIGSSVDSNEISKRIWLIGNVLMTCGEVKKEGNHIKILEEFACAMKLTGGK